MLRAVQTVHCMAVGPMASLKDLWPFRDRWVRAPDASCRADITLHGRRSNEGRILFQSSGHTVSRHAVCLDPTCHSVLFCLPLCISTVCLAETCWPMFLASTVETSSWRNLEHATDHFHDFHGGSRELNAAPRRLRTTR